MRPFIPEARRTMFGTRPAAGPHGRTRPRVDPRRRTLANVTAMARASEHGFTGRGQLSHIGLHHARTRLDGSMNIG
jgi:hypothetical protein